MTKYKSTYGMPGHQVERALRQFRLPITAPLMAGAFATAVAIDLSLSSVSAVAKKASRASRFYRAEKITCDTTWAQEEALAKTKTPPGAAAPDVAAPSDGPATKMFKFFVQISPTRHLHFVVPEDTTIEQVKSMAFFRAGQKMKAELEDHFMDNHRHVLKDTTPIKSCGIGQDGTLRLKRRVRGGAPEMMSEQEIENCMSMEQLDFVENHCDAMIRAAATDADKQQWQTLAVHVSRRKTRIMQEMMNNARADAQYAQARERAADRARQEAEDRNGNLNAQVRNLQHRARPPTLAEMTPEDYAAFKQNLGNDIARLWPSLTRAVDGLLPHGWEELVTVVCDALRAQVFAVGTDPRNQRSITSHVSCICGDIQRGKSTVEALIAVIVYSIHTSRACNDSTCTVVVSCLRAWAWALKGTMESKTSLTPSDDDGLVDEEGGVLPSDLGAMPLANLAGRGGKASVKQTLARGGTSAHFRSDSQYTRAGKIIAEINDEKQPQDKALVPIFICDEVDKFLGDPRAKHARVFSELMGWSTTAPTPSDIPAIVFCVTATATGPCLYFLRRLCNRDTNNRLLLKLVDIMSFRPASAAGYSGDARAALPEGEVVNVPKPSDEYMTEQIKDLHVSAFTQPSSLTINSCCTRVNKGVVHNMQNHVEALAETVEADAQADVLPGMALFVHGGHTTHLGMMAIRGLFDEYGEDDETFMERLRVAFEDAAADQHAHANQLQATGNHVAQAAHARGLANALSAKAATIVDDYNTDTDCLEVHHLTTLAWWYYEKAVRLGHYAADEIQAKLKNQPPLGSWDPEGSTGRSYWSSEDLQVALTLMRVVIWPDAPILVAGGAMLRRCLSLTIVDYFQPKVSVEIDGAAYAEVAGQPRCTGMITHQCHMRAANAADGAQLHQRFRTTLTNFVVAHPEFAETSDLSVDDLAEAAEMFRAWNAMPVWRQPLAQRSALIDQIRRDIDGHASVQQTIQLFANSLDSDEKRTNWERVREQIEQAEDLFDEDPDRATLMGLACSLALRVPDLPLACRLVLETHKNSLFQSRCGVAERDLGDLWSILVKLLIAQWMAEQNIRAQAADGANAPGCALSTWDVLWGVRARFPECLDPNDPRGRTGLPGYSEFGITTTNSAGCGFALNNLYKRDLVCKAKVRRVKRDPPAGNHGLAAVPVGTRATEMNVWWLRHDAQVPPAAAAVAAAGPAGPAAGPLVEELDD